jgi:hypothetical protein
MLARTIIYSRKFTKISIIIINFKFNNNNSLLHFLFNHQNTNVIVADLYNVLQQNWSIDPSHMPWAILRE